MKTHDNIGLKRIAKALQWSLTGLREALVHEAAFRQEAVVAVVLLPLGLWLGQGGVEKALLGGSVLLVLTVELVNSAIEAAVDRTGEAFHPLAGRAKDMGSAAVFLSMLLAGFTWACVLLF